MKWNIYVTTRGPSGHDVEVPSSVNPIECENLASMLADLATNLPTPSGDVEVVGVRVEQCRQPGLPLDASKATMIGTPQEGRDHPASEGERDKL